MQQRIPGADKDPSYWATGISVVLHPKNPNIPSMHFNTRYLSTTKTWFGGGIDVTPCLEFDAEKEKNFTIILGLCAISIIQIITQSLKSGVMNIFSLNIVMNPEVLVAYSSTI